MLLMPLWTKENKIFIVDQTQLPKTWSETEITTIEEMHYAIKTLMVRGAPAIGNAAAFGMYLGAKNSGFTDGDSLKDVLKQAGDYLATARPTAVNLFWAIGHMQHFADGLPKDADRDALLTALFTEAKAVLNRDIATCKAIGRHGAGLLKHCSGILTHCNAGALATGAYGTALAPIYTLLEQGIRPKVYSDETRPLLQGSRLTAYELQRSGADVVTICDNMAGYVMAQGKVQAVIVGADRIAANGDTANKIGTYSLGVLAKYHGIPLYIAAPFTTVDFDCIDGRGIPIEERKADEVRTFCGVQSAPIDIPVYNPAFDVTPNELITAIITENGVAYPPFAESLAQLKKA
ncbi:MAG: S-methyl-5-thioribose-1-phosphate isomerase [Clostridiales bacterium]|nr:S-methyl-5-thioribose-1-phosphate isomerase [Clostridiales bacterium]